MSLLLSMLFLVAVAGAAMAFAYKMGILEGRDRARDEMHDRAALAAAAHRHFCLTPGEPTHEPDEIDFDKADEVLEILAALSSSGEGGK